MKIPTPLRMLLLKRARRIMRSRRPDVIIGSKDEPYMLRWHLIPRNRLFNVYLHHFKRSDDDRALHDHPWVNCSILLAGEYIEWTKQKFPLMKECGGTEKIERAGGLLRQQGFIYFRRSVAAHRVELLPLIGKVVVPDQNTNYKVGDNFNLGLKECVTLFVTGPKIREWGFHCPKGWIPWQQFCDTQDHGVAGKGCE